MAKHKRREQESVVNENINHNTMNTANNPFGIDPMQLLGLLGGNFDMRNMGNMLASMNTNGFNLNNLGPLAQMAGLNLDNTFTNGSNNLNRNTNTNTSFTSDIQNMSSNNNMNKNEMNMQKHNEVNSRDNIKMNNHEELRQEKSAEKINKSKNNTVDENLEFLIALKGFVHQSKVPFIDRIIDGYKKGLFR